MLETFHFDSGIEGEHLLVLGAIHGNEICGPVALNKIVKQFQNGQLNILRGKVTFVPVCNPKAYEQNVRFVDRNLNRYMSPVKNPKVYEDDLTNALCPLLQNADVLLDVHSYSVGGVPFAFIRNPNSVEVLFAKATGVSHMVYGFSNAYQNTAAQMQEDREEAKKQAMGTTEYMRQFGGYGFTLECGKNGSVESIEFAEYAVLNALGFLGMIGHREISVVDDPMVVEIENVYYRKEGEQIVCECFNFASIDRGDIITEVSGAPHVVAESDSVIVLPNVKTPVGQEWFYLGRSVN